jgi:PAS domain S-box-containing protein
MAREPKATGIAREGSDERLREMNEALLVSSVRMHELAEQARNAGMALRESEARFRFMAESMPQKVFTATAAGEVNYINRQWLEYTGLTLAQIKRWEWEQIIYPDDLEPTMRLWKHSLETGQPFEIEHRCRRADGQYLWHLSRARAMFDAEGNTTIWIGSSTEIQHQKELALQLENRVEERTANLAAAMSELEGFNYTVAHDLRAPLRAILFASKILVQEAFENLTEDQRTLLMSQAGNAEKLAKLVDSLLQFSRLSRVPLERAMVDLSDLARSVADEESGLGSTGRCAFEIQAGMNCYADAGLLRLVIANLIQNACKFSPNGGNVVVSSESLDGRPVYLVKDQGIGFNMAYVGKIFLPFERLHRDDEYPGTGIGLATVKRIVERHGGQVWADSSPGKGTTVFFTLGMKSTEADEQFDSPVS